MLLLALESSANPASVAVCSDRNLLGQYFQNSKLTHSKTLLPMAEALLRNLDITISDIGLIAVSRGPGSFTGVRIGVSVAKGMAWGAGIPVCGVSTLEAMAYQTPEQGIIICPVMDARRDQVYNALFEWRDGKPARLCDDRVISLDYLSTDLKDYGSHCMLVGDGAAISHEFLSAKSISCTIPPDLLHYQTAYGVALAALNSKQVPSVELEPNYLRPSQAERERVES